MSAKTCRICLGGEEDEIKREEGEGEEDLGPLISPCKCKGTAKYVHVWCLQQWRARSISYKSFIECDLCHYKYSLRRTKVATWVASKKSQTVMTIFALLLCIFLAGYAANPILDLFLGDQGSAFDMFSYGGPSFYYYSGGGNGGFTSGSGSRDVKTAIVNELLSRGGGESSNSSLVRWAQHMSLGTVSLGLLGAARFYIRPVRWLFGGGNTRLNSRNKTILAVAVVFGVYTVSRFIWSILGRLSRLILSRMARFILDDVPESINDDDDETEAEIPKQEQHVKEE